MSQDTFPFADGEDTSYDDTEGTRSRRKLVIAGGALAVLVLGAGAYLFLGGSSDSAVDTAFVPMHRTPRTVTAPKTAVKSAIKLPAPYKQQLGRDPFRALYVQPAAAPAVAAGTAMVAGVPSTTSVPGQTTPSGSTTAGTGSTPVAPASKEYKLVLMRVYGTGTDRTGVFSIDGKQQVAKIGTKFGALSEIVLLSFQQGPKPGQWTTVLQVGDGDPFDVVTGTPAYVR